MHEIPSEAFLQMRKFEKQTPKIIKNRNPFKFYFERAFNTFMEYYILKISVSKLHYY